VHPSRRAPRRCSDAVEDSHDGHSAGRRSPRGQVPRTSRGCSSWRPGCHRCRARSATPSRRMDTAPARPRCSISRGRPSTTSSRNTGSETGERANRRTHLTESMKPKLDPVELRRSAIREAIGAPLTVGPCGATTGTRRAAARSRPSRPLQRGPRAARRGQKPRARLRGIATTEGTPATTDAMTEVTRPWQPTRRPSRGAMAPVRHVMAR
jgi:hypothetical protein